MGIGLFDKLTNFLMPLPENEKPPDDGKITALPNRNRDRKGYDLEQPLDPKPLLKVHSHPLPASLKIVVEEAHCFDDVQKYADYLKSNNLVLINFQKIPPDIQERICDFMNGVCYTLGGSVQRVSEHVVLYAYASLEIDKKFFSYSVPTYERVPVGE